ncbi:MAG: hypothetical protein KGI38_11370 [Thaumarchaeota archaeon]|nr:hypothetical protein [Nitrososphaerota archaeon]
MGADLSEMTLTDLITVVEYEMKEYDFESPKEAAEEIDKRLGTDIRHRIGMVNTEIQSVWEGLEKAKREVPA